MDQHLISRGAAAMLAGTILWAAAPALAQSQSPAAEAKDGGGIEEVVVTATRRAEVLSKVPESISAFSRDKMDNLGVKSFADLAEFTPGVRFDPTTKNVAIRGVDSTAGAGTTGIYIDDTPIQIRALGFGSDNTLPAVFDLERVEVLRGPQGTLFGAGSEGGTVRYITPQPSLSDYSVYARSEVSTTENGAPSYEAGAAFGGPIVDGKLGFRVSLYDRHDGGWVDRVRWQDLSPIDKNDNWTDTFVARAALAWAPTKGLLITPGIYYQYRNKNNIDDYWVAISNPNKGVYRTGTPDRMNDLDNWYLPTLKIDYDTGPVEIIANTSYFDRKEYTVSYSPTLYNLSYFQTTLDPSVPGNPTDPNYVSCAPGQCANIYPLLTPTGLNLPGYGQDYISWGRITNQQHSLVQEVRAQSTDPDARLTWVAGLFYSEESQLSIEEIIDPQLPQLTQYLWGEDMLTAWGEQLLPGGVDYINHTQGHDQQLAAYANMTFAATADLKLQAGVRYAATHFDFTNYSDGPQNFGYGSGAGHKDEHPVTPMARLTYNLSDDDLVYATYSEGYRIGGANPPFPFAACQPDLQAFGITSVPGSFNSDTVTNYEIGTKDKFESRRLEVATSAFHLEWNNIQQYVYLPGCGFQYIANLGKAQSDGFDLQVNWLPTDALEFDLAVGYVDARYSSTANAGSSPASQPIALKGDVLPGSPWTVSLGGQYSFTAFGRASFLRFDYDFASRNPGMQPAMDPGSASYDGGLVQDPATNLVSLRAGMTVSSVQVNLFVDNLLDSHPQLGLNHQDASTLLYEAHTLRPRTIGLSATYRY